MDLDARFKAACSIADEAAALALSYFEHRAELTVELKGAQDHVSIADREVESLIRRRVTESFPEDGLLGEEHGGGAPSQALWVIDPIDGTTNFLHGLPHWGVCIAFVGNGVVEHGVIVAPVFDDRYVARRGRGALCNGRQISVSTTTALDQALIGFGSNRKTALAPYLEKLGGLLQQGIEYRRLGSATLNLASVATGKLDGFYEALLSPWDALAGMLLVSEAGGRCNPYLEGDALKKGNVVLATNAPLYDALARALGVA